MNTKRKNPFARGKDEWVILSPQRMQRPWNGKTESVEEEDFPSYDSSCHFCPGNTRQNGDINPKYTKTFVFPNDNPAFTPPDHAHTKQEAHASLFFTEVPVNGICEVVVYTPHHNRLLMHMTHPEIEEVIHTWITRYKELGKKDYINHVAIFETRGKELGNSMPHPHGQIWAENSIPPAVAAEIKTQQKLSNKIGSNALISYLNEELEKDERIVYQNKNFAIVVPYWANLPYECMIVPLKPIGSIDVLTDEQVTDLAHILKIQTSIYAKIFDRPKYGVSYVFSIHQRPTDREDYPFFQMHFHFRTPMMTPTRQKYFAGYEEYFGFQRDMIPEIAAQTLKKAVQE